jgi:antitoxin component YwqK of YwqJK toxin-antitoxin module
MKKWIFLLLLASCHHATQEVPLTMIQIQDRNGITETVSNTDRLSAYQTVDFLSSQPYKKVLRVYKNNGKTHSKITTYHPNGTLFQYLEAEEMRAHGAYQEWFPNGQQKIEAHVIGGTADVATGSQRDWIFEGVSQVWDEQGNLVAQIPYLKGDLEGISTYYYPDGQVEKEVPFHKNQIEGDLFEYFPDGTLKTKTHYKNNLKGGESLAYFDNGQQAAQETFSEGLLLHGTYYNPQGEQISQIGNGGGYQAQFEGAALTLTEYRMGKPDGYVKKFTPTGQLHRQYRIKNGKKHGEEIEYYTDEPGSKPQPKLSVEWNENAIHGTVKTWYSNGQLQSQRDFSKNQKSGPSLAWYKNGSLMLLEEYEEDKLLSGQYYKINRQEPVSTVINGNGLVTLFDEAGLSLRKIPYHKGKPVDPEN